MKKVKLSEEEKELLMDFEAGEFKYVLTPDRKQEIVKAAAETFNKDKRINIQISAWDLQVIQKRAFEEDIPYQTLVSSILHKYVSGGLYDLTANKPIKRTL